MSRQQIIDAIRQQTPSFDEQFLTHFADSDLARFLRRLTEIQGRRGRGSIWVREDSGLTVSAAR